MAKQRDGWLRGVERVLLICAEITGWDTGAKQGALFDDSHQLSALIGRPTPPVSVAVADALKSVS